MEKYFEIFLKSIVTAAGISLVGGVCIMLKIMVTYSDTLNSIDKRINNIEQAQIISDSKWNLFVTQYNNSNGNKFNK